MVSSSTKNKAVAKSSKIPNVLATKQLRHNVEVTIGTKEKPLEVIFPKSEYDEGKSARITLGVDQDLRELLNGLKDERGPNVAMPIKEYQADIDEPVKTQIVFKAINTDKVLVFEEGVATGTLTTCNLGRGDKIQCIIKPYEYKTKKQTKSFNFTEGLSLQLWCVRIISRGDGSTPTHLYAESDF